MLRVDVVRCSGEAYCLDENAAKEKISGNSIVLATNRLGLDHSLYGPESIVKEGIIDFFSLMTTARVEIPIKISRTQVRLQDLYVSLDEVT